MMDLFDVDAVEAAEASIDQFIERRSRERADANKEEEYWLEPVLRHQERRREHNRLLWHAYHLDRAECLERTAAELAASHRSKAAALADGGEGVGS